MDKWAEDVAFRVAAMTKADPTYQELLEQCEKEEKVYLKIMETLTDEKRLQVDDYIAVCEELQYRMSQLAYELGMADGQRFCFPRSANN